MSAEKGAALPIYKHKDNLANPSFKIKIKYLKKYV